MEHERSLETVVLQVKVDKESGKIPTTFVPLAPEKMYVDEEGIDALVGLFHIMWNDMPSPRTYSVKLCERVNKSGDYVGCRLVCNTDEKLVIAC